MREEDKPFICYRKGRWSFQIAPRNAAGVRASLFWMLALLPIMGLFFWALDRAPNDETMWLYTAIYVGAMLVWSIAMIRWMKARSEMVDMAELMAIKRERDAAKKRHGR